MLQQNIQKVQFVPPTKKHERALHYSNQDTPTPKPSRGQK